MIIFSRYSGQAALTNKVNCARYKANFDLNLSTQKTWETK